MPFQIKLKPNGVPTGMGPSPSIILVVINNVSKINLFGKFLKHVSITYRKAI